MYICDTKIKELITIKKVKIMATINVKKFIEIANEKVVDKWNSYINIVDYLKCFQWEKKLWERVEEEKLDELVEKELDERNSNGHFSRWTNHGNNIWHEYEKTKKLYFNR